MVYTFFILTDSKSTRARQFVGIEIRGHKGDSAKSRLSVLLSNFVIFCNRFVGKTSEETLLSRKS